MEALGDLNQELESQQKRNISEAADLREKIKSLWIKLEVDEAGK